MIDFKFADIGEGIHEGVILKWHFEVGDKVQEGDTLCVIETDKVNAEIPAPEGGILKKRGAEVGDTIHVGETLAVIDDGSGEEPKEETSKPEEPKEEKKTESASESNASVVGAIESSDEVLAASNEADEDDTIQEEDTKVLATPVARRMAKELNVNLSQVSGTGPNGRIMKADIKSASQDTSTSSGTRPTYKMPKLPTEGVRREKISKLRKAVVQAMDISNTLIPATTVMDEFDVTELVRLRTSYKEKNPDADVKLTYLPLIIKALILTLKKFPVFNSSFDHENEEIVYKEFFNIGIAVDTENGLMVPNIKNADQKSILELAKDIETLASNARERKTQLSDLQNTTFSITNYGAFGSKLGTPVIKHPEVAILGMGAITKKPVVENGEIVIRDIFPVSLTIDHRVIDGGDAGRFLVELRNYLTNPMSLLLS